MIDQSAHKKVRFAVVFADIIRIEPLPEKATIHTAEVTAMKEDIRWVIYTDSLNSMLAIEKKENHPILNQI